MKEEILLAAERLFAQKGFSKTTLRDLSRESGANTALVSYYFGSKKGLRRAVIERQLQRALRTVGPVMDGDTIHQGEGLCALFQGERVDEAAFLNVMDGVFESIQSDPTFMRLMLAALTENDAEVRDEMKHYLLEPLFNGVCEMIRKLVGPQSRISEVELKARALLFCGQMHHYSLVKWSYIQEVATGVKMDEILASYRKIVINALLSLRSEFPHEPKPRQEEAPSTELSL